MFYVKSRSVLRSLVTGLCVGGMALSFSGALFAEEAAKHDSTEHAQHTGMNSQSPGWAEKLKGQTIVENSMEGRAERAALVEQQHNRLMQQMQKDMEHNGPNTGMYNSMSMIHQYGGGPGNGLLSSSMEVEPVSGKGGLCPKTAKVRNYDISAINVEITLNQWLDYTPVLQATKGLANRIFGLFHKEIFTIKSIYFTL